METKPKSFVVACKSYFGFKTLPNGQTQSLLDFKTEVQQLTPADRAELAPMLAKQLGEPVAA